MYVVIRVSDLQTFHGKSYILHGISLEVNEGEIVAALGRMVPARQRRFAVSLVYTDGRAPSKYLAKIRHTGRRIGLQDRALVTCLRGENFRKPDGAGILKLPQACPARGIWICAQLFPGLAERKSQLGRQLSGGEQEMLSIARPLLLNPRVMLLEEPSQGLAPLIVREVMQVVRRMREDGLSARRIQQNVPLSLSIADRAYILDYGKVVHSAKAAELAKAPSWSINSPALATKPRKRRTRKLFPQEAGHDAVAAQLSLRRLTRYRQSTSCAEHDFIGAAVATRSSWRVSTNCDDCE